MTHDQLLKKILKSGVLGRELGKNEWIYDNKTNALRAVVELLQEFNNDWMLDGYQNSYLLLAIKEAIEKELNG